MSKYVIVFLILVLFVYSYIKKVNTYESFVKGAKKSLILVYEIVPYTIAIFILVELFRTSGLALVLTDVLHPFFSLLGIPRELIELVLIRPFSGSGSLALLSEIYASYGVDTYIGRSASVIMGSSETVFYVSAIYFSKTSVKKLGYAIPIALFASLVSAIMACFVCKFM